MQNVQTLPIEPTRISIACISCKTRKRRCDGSKPKCANCTARNLDCNYAPIRRTRGPAKKKSQGDVVEAQPDGKQHHLPPSLLLGNGNSCPGLRENIITTKNTTGPIYLGLQDGVVVNIPTSRQPTPVIDPSQTQVSIKNRIPIFPEFLLPGAFDENLKTYKTAIEEGIAARNFTPLMPLYILRRLIQNSFADIMPEHQLMPLCQFLTHLDDQYAASPNDPGDNPARWALVNAIVALGCRWKTAPGSQGLDQITFGFYKNATKILPELILKDPHLLSIQALLAMASFAREVENVSAFVMLSSNASRQLELLTMSWSSTDRLIDVKDMGQYEQAYKVANVFEKYIREFLGTNAALCEEQSVGLQSG